MFVTFRLGRAARRIAAKSLYEVVSQGRSDHIECCIPSIEFSQKHMSDANLSTADGPVVPDRTRRNVVLLAICQALAVISTGRCNTLVKSVCGRFKL